MTRWQAYALYLAIIFAAVIYVAVQTRRYKSK